eukprot:271649-Rhodomonas_salina.2
MTVTRVQIRGEYGEGERRWGELCSHKLKHDVKCSRERTGNQFWEGTRCKCFDEHIQLCSSRARVSETDSTLDALRHYNAPSL